VLSQRKKAESLVPKASELSKAAASSSLESAAKAKDVVVAKAPMFTRTSFVNGLGRMNEAIGAAFALPVGTVSEPIVTDQATYVIRVDRRVTADSAAWVKQMENQRRELTGTLRQARVRDYLESIRKHANVKDKRKALNAAARQQAS
jgi:ribonuclease HIII